MIDKQSFIRDCEAVRAQSPLVHSITNYVAMEINANALLAIGASPLMSFCAEEMEEIVSIASALVINIGCLDRLEIEGMRIAAATAHRLGKPWVLDPVGAGASKIRTQTSLELIRDSHPTIIRGNASEIMALAGAQIVSRGVDSSNSSSDALESAKALAQATGAVVSVSGATDYITDGERVATISNGHPIMSRITAMGCTASAVTGAFAAVCGDAFEAAWAAMAMMGVAGDIAAARSAATGVRTAPAAGKAGEAQACTGAIKGTGTMGVEFMDALSTFDAEAAAALIKE